MQRVKSKLQKLQQGPTLPTPTNMLGIRPKPFVNQHDYHVMKQSEIQGPYDQDRCIGLLSTIEQQIRAHGILLRQIYDEDQNNLKNK